MACRPVSELFGRNRCRPAHPEGDLIHHNQLAPAEDSFDPVTDGPAQRDHAFLPGPLVRALPGIEKDAVVLPWLQTAHDVKDTVADDFDSRRVRAHHFYY